MKSEAQQAQAVAFRTRELLAHQRTQLTNALRSHLGEFGVVIAQRAHRIQKLNEKLDATLEAIPAEAVDLIRLYARQIEDVNNQIVTLERRLKTTAANDKETRRMQTMPGVGPITAMAVKAYCPPPEQFERGREFAAWLGLVPRQHSTGGKARLGRVTKTGQKDVRRLLVNGANALIVAYERTGRANDPWLVRMLETKPRMVVAVAFANRMAHRVWAMMSKEENTNSLKPPEPRYFTDTRRTMRTKPDLRNADKREPNPENQPNLPGPQARTSKMDPVRALHKGQRYVPHKKAGHIDAPDPVSKVSQELVNPGHPHIDWTLSFEQNVLHKAVPEKDDRFFGLRNTPNQ